MINKNIVKVGNLPLGTFVKCFGIKCVLFDHKDGFCRMASRSGIFNVPFSQLVQLVKFQKL